ncbi:hypothetical protein [Natrinema marinum]|uniref:hypothetical protein n=1 Tax=Natrinema marinum TaxID=2961598 RepID=UPI0020C87C1E|nr:hypothetical protein [Natrinema marinum]
MPEMEQQDRTLSELIVKEAVERGMDSPMRESILEAVEESGEASSGGRLPLAGALFGLGAAVGFLAGRQSELQETSIEDIEEPEIIEDVRETAQEATETDEVDVETDSGSRLPRALLALGVLAGAVFLRRRLSSSDEEEWEPIEEFEPATGADTDEEFGDMGEEDVEDVGEMDGEPEELGDEPEE